MAVHKSGVFEFLEKNYKKKFVFSTLFFSYHFNMTEVFVHPTCGYLHSIQDGDMILEETSSDFLSMSCVNDWLQKSPRATATLVMFDDDTSIEIPVYALRRRNAIVENLPDAPIYHHQ